MEKKSINNKEMNGMWKGGISPGYYQKLAKQLPNICNECLTTNNLEIHHINKNPKDNRLENLRILCRSCHTRIHNKYRNFHQLNNPQITKKCIYCLKEFKYYQSIQPKAKYCSNLCRRLDHSRLLKLSWKKRKSVNKKTKRESNRN